MFLAVKALRTEKKLELATPEEYLQCQILNSGQDSQDKASLEASPLQVLQDVYSFVLSVS